MEHNVETHSKLIQMQWESLNWDLMTLSGQQATKGDSY